MSTNLEPWPGTHPVGPDERYPHTVTEHGHDTLITIYAMVSRLYFDHWDVWNFQGHGGCSYHWESPILMICNAQDGGIGTGDPHPNLHLVLPDGQVIEALWDELAAKPYRVSTSHVLTDDLCARMLTQAVIATMTYPTEIEEIVRDPDLPLADRPWIYEHTVQNTGDHTP